MSEKNVHKKKLNKIMTEKEAVSKFLKDGASFTIGGFLLNREGDSVFREIARQGQKNLKFIGESCTLTVDILIGLGALDRFDQAYIPQRQIGGIAGLPCLDQCLNTGDPRPVDMGGILKTKDYQGTEEPLRMVDWTNYMLSLRFVAGSMNVPFMPCRTGLGTDIIKNNEEIIMMKDPYEDTEVALVPACNPDVAFINVQRADRRGNGQIFGHKGVDEWKARAAKHVVLFAEEIVSTDTIMENPTMTVVPSHCTDAVVHLPFCSHPNGVFGCNSTDPLFILESTIARQTPDGHKAWMDEWVFGCDSHFEYCEKFGWEKLEVLAKSEKKLNPLPR